MKANTLSGLCVSIPGELPETGDEIIYLNLKFNVQSVENHRVAKLLIEQLEADEAEQAGTLEDVKLE